jgi:multidrug efflux pump subunit AcrA (membrane-fusion protein)
MRFNALLMLGALLLLAGCSNFGQPAPAALPTVVLDDNKNTTPQASHATNSNTGNSNAGGTGGSVTASGMVVPAQEVHMAFTLQEVVKTVSVSAGEQVKAGQELARLDDTLLQAQIQQAQATVASAQANYDLLAAGPTDEQLRQAEAVVVVATANYSRTIAGARPSDIAAAQSALKAAADAYNKVKAGPQPMDYAAAEATFRNAEAALQQAQFAYDAAYKQNPAGIGASPAALALQQATNNFNAAKAAYDKVSQQPDAAQISAAYQQVQSARAALDVAVNPARDFDVAQAKAQVDTAQAQLDALKAGARAQQLAAAKAQVDAAKAALSVLQAQLMKYTLVAPWDAVLLKREVEPGETVLPGTPVLVLAPLDKLRVQTKDLSEIDVPKIKVGQPARVFVKALNQTVNGRVSEISPLADTLGGDVVYATTVDLDTLPAGLRAGMSVEVRFGAGE